VTYELRPTFVSGTRKVWTYGSVRILWTAASGHYYTTMPDGRIFMHETLLEAIANMRQELGLVEPPAPAEPPKRGRRVELLEDDP